VALEVVVVCALQWLEWDWWTKVVGKWSLSVSDCLPLYGWPLLAHSKLLLLQLQSLAMGASTVGWPSTV